MRHRVPSAWARGLRRAAAATAAAVALAGMAGERAADAQAPRPAVSTTKPADAAPRVIPVRGNIFMIAGAGGNVTVSAGRSGLVVVDTGTADRADALLGTLQELSRRVTARGGPDQLCLGMAPGCAWWSSSEFFEDTVSPRAPRPIIGIINTSGDRERIGGNATLSAAGRVFGAGLGAGSGASNAWIVAHEHVALEMSKMTPALPPGAMPSEVYFGKDKKLNHLNGEAVVVSHRPAAHSGGDSIVHFRASDVLAVGEILDMTSYPVIAVDRGGSIGGMVDALNAILDVTVVEHMMEGGTIVVPGRGRLVDAADVAYYRDMMTTACRR